MEQTAYQMLDIGQLLANDATVSQNKYGFFLCRKGEADILLDNHSFHIEAGVLCLYTPYTFIRIIRHTDNIEGCLMEGELDTIQSALSNIPAAERFAIRSHPCVKLGTAGMSKAGAGCGDADCTHRTASESREAAFCPIASYTGAGSAASPLP